MHVLDSLKRVPGALRRNPVLVVPVAAFLLVQAPQLLIGTVAPALQSALSIASNLLVVALTPFYVSGLFTMADEALDGTTSLGSFVGGGKRHYVPFLVAYVVLLAINVAIGVVLSIGVFVALIVGISGSAFVEPGPLLLGAVGVAAAVAALAYLAVNFLLQFFGEAVVLDGTEGIEALKRSASLVRRNPVSVFGFVLLRGVISLVGAVPAVVVTLSVMPEGDVFPLPELSTAALATVAVGGYLLSVLVTTVTSTYSVSFYRALTA